MERRFGDVDFPELLIQSLEEDELVVFAGAGVSRGYPSNLPSFRGLVEEIERITETEKRSHESDDQFLGRVNQQRGTDVHSRTIQFLKEDDPEPNQLHHDLVSLFEKPESVRIVTTNYDTLLEQAAGDAFSEAPSVFQAPALPLGHDFNGVVHLHGSWNQPPDRIVLTDKDFGRAYLSEGWARDFLVEMFGEYDVLFVGYSHNDVVVKYLSRGLPPSSDASQYALDDKDDDDYDPTKWHLLDVEPIEYPNPDGDHQSLLEAIRKWRDQANWGGLDKRHRVRRLVLQRNADANTDEPLNPQHTLSPQDSDFLNAAIHIQPLVEAFVEFAPPEPWAGWLAEQGQLDGIFGREQLSDPENRLTEWLAQDVALEAPEALRTIIASQGGSLPPAIAQPLIRTLAFGGDPSRSVLRTWIPLLLPHIRESPNSEACCLLLKKLADRDLGEAFVSVFKCVVTARSSVGNRVVPTDIEEGVFQQETETETGFFQSSYQLGEALDSARANLNREWKRQSFDSVVESLLDADRQTSLGSRRILGQRRSAIADHEQDRHPQGIDRLIDFARDVLQRELGWESSWSERRIDDLIDSETLLLNRIGLYGLRLSNTRTSKQKIQEIVRNTWIFDTLRRREVFKLLQSAYADAESKTREDLLDRIEEGPERDTEEKHENLVKFRLFRFISKSLPECKSIETRKRELYRKLPITELSPYPDLTSYVTEPTPISDKPRKTAEELRHMAAGDVLNLLSKPAPDDYGFDRREADRLELREAVSLEPEWALDLCEALLTSPHGHSRVWTQVFLGLNDAVLKNQQWGRILEMLVERQDDFMRLRDAAKWLRDGMVEQEIAAQHFPEANELARAIWQRPAEQGWKQRENWFERAINTTAGRVAQFWVREAICIYTDDDPRVPPTDLGEVLTELEKLLTGDDDRNLLAASAVAVHSPSLVVIDHDWTAANIKPLLDWNQSPREARAAWDGFAFVTNVSLELVEVFEEAYKSLFDHLEKYDRRTREGVMNQLAVIILHAVDDPLDEWLGPFLAKTDTQDLDGGSEFLRALSTVLDGVDKAKKVGAWDRWLKEFYERRTDSVPVPPTPEERSALLNIGVRHPALLERVTSIASDWNADIRYTDVHTFSLTPNISDSQISSRYSEAVGRFVRVLARCVPKAEDDYCGPFSHLLQQLAKNSDVPVVDIREAALSLQQKGCSHLGRVFNALG